VKCIQKHVDVNQEKKLYDELKVEQVALELTYQHILHSCIDDNVSPSYFRNEAKKAITIS